MSVVIRGMEMPTTCRDCRLSTLTDFDSMPFCNITMDDICFNDWETKRCDNCPLVPVPPHGDLIDASTKITVQTYDDMDDEYYEEECTIADALDHWSYEGCPKVIIPAEEGE